MSTHKIEVVPVRLCACGCGNELLELDSRGRPRVFIHGHNPRPEARKTLCTVCYKNLVSAKDLCKSCYSSSRYYRIMKQSPERFRLQKKQLYQDLRAAVVALYGGKCKCCDEDDPAFLHLDHARGGGRAHRKKVGAQSIYREALLQGPSAGKYRLLCANCNLAKARGLACPHEVACGPLGGWGFLSL